MKGTLTRVFALYPMAIPAIVMALAAAYPGYLTFDQVTQRMTLSFTMPELLAVFGGGYAIVGGIFAKWGIKK